MLEVARELQIPKPHRSPTRSAVRPPMVFAPPVWDYKHLIRRVPDEALLDEAELNSLGAEWWELVSVHGDGTTVHFYFKRALS